MSIRTVLSAAALAVCTITAAQPVRAEYPLQPGDMLRLSIAGMPNAATEAMVGPDGTANFAWVGRVDATGQTVSEVLTQVQALAGQRVVKNYTNDGQLSVIQLAPEDVFLEVAAYRPVIVSGEVDEPGEVLFRVGMTIRDAIAMRGGALGTAGVGAGRVDAGQVIRWQDDYASAALDHALETLRLWRINAEIDEDWNPEPPERSMTSVPEDVFHRMVADQRRLLEIRRQNNAGELDFLQSSLEQMRNRFSLLTRQQAELAEALAADEEEEQRTLDLMGRGLAPASRVADMRRNTVQAATRLLDVEDNLSQTELNITRLEREREALEEARMTELLDLRAETQDNALRFRVQLQNLGRNLGGGAAAMFGGEGILPEVEVLATVHRRDNSGVAAIPVTLDDDLHPGDNVEVRVVPLERPAGGAGLPGG